MVYKISAVTGIELWLSIKLQSCARFSHLLDLNFVTFESDSIAFTTIEYGDISKWDMVDMSMRNTISSTSSRKFYNIFLNSRVKGFQHYG